MDSDKRSSDDTARPASDPSTLASELPEILEVFGSQPLVHEVADDLTEDAPMLTEDSTSERAVDAQDSGGIASHDLTEDDLEAIAEELESESRTEELAAEAPAASAPSASPGAPPASNAPGRNAARGPAPERPEIVRGANGPGFASPVPAPAPTSTPGPGPAISGGSAANATASVGAPGFFGPSAPSSAGSSTATPSAPSTPATLPSAAPAATSAHGHATAGSRPSEDRVVLLLDQLYRGMESGLTKVRDLVQLQDARVGRLEQSMEDVARQIGFVPGKLRGLGSKLDEVASVASDARCRELLSELFAVDDMLKAAREAFPRKARSKLGKEARRYFDSIATRLGQLLEGQGVMPIPSEGAFDAKLHQAVESRPVSDPDRDGVVVEVFRAGWRTEHSVLRYAEVAVGRFDPDAPDDDDDDPGSDSKRRSRSRKSQRNRDDAHAADKDGSDEPAASLDIHPTDGDTAADRDPSISLRTGER